MKMPGYDAYKKQIEAEERREQSRLKRQRIERANEDLKRAKMEEIAKKVPGLGFKNFLSNSFMVFVSTVIVGSFAWLTSSKEGFHINLTNYDNFDDEETPSWTYDIYGDMSYGQAIKNAYLWDDFRKGNGGLFQGICGMISIALSLGLGGMLASIKNGEEKRQKIESAFDQLEQLKNYGVNAKKIMSSLEPAVRDVVSKMSELDRGYLENLLAGGLSKANYETVTAIVSGFLKSHPDEYNRIVQIIDEATLPEEVVKKYGKGKTVSFGAANVMMENDIRK